MILLSCAAVAAVAVSAQDTPGFQFIGYGYDILYGNPHSTRNGDSGFRANIFKFSHSEGQRTSDGKWEVPDKTTSQDFGNTCSATQISRIVTSAYDYQHRVDNGISLNAGFMGLEFSLSLDFKNIDNQTRSNTSIFAQVSARCAAYQLTTHIFDHPEVDPNFVVGVNYLPDHYIEDQYMLFLQSFGTHVVTQLQVGGRWGWQMEFNRLAYINMLDNSINVEAGLEYAGKIKAGIKLNHTDDVKSAMVVSRAILKNSSFNVGGRYSPDMKTWMDSVKAQPMPTHLTLLPLYELFNSMYLPTIQNVTQLALKGAAMREAMTKYCLYVKKHFHADASCVPPRPLPPPKPDPVASNAIRRICVLNEGGYAMNWELTHISTQYLVKSATGNYAHGETDCLDGLTVGAQHGDKLTCRANVIGGKSQDCERGSFIYDSRAQQQANFRCDGSTYTVHCTFTGFSHYGDMDWAAEQLAQEEQEEQDTVVLI